MGYEGLLSLLRTSAEEFRQALDDERDNPVECPNDGEPLESAPDGGVFCRYDGWRPDC